VVNLVPYGANNYKSKFTSWAWDEVSPGILVGSAPNGMARIDPRTGVKPGGRVTFTVDPARLYFFDPDTGAAITG
jgi:hypothetical protein